MSNREESIDGHFLSNLGEDLSEEKDQSILKRMLVSGEGGAKPKDGSEVEISVKGIYENRVFDERSVKFVIGEGVLHHIPQGFVLIGSYILCVEVIASSLCFCL